MKSEIIHENYEKIDIIKDFWKINQIVREDIYLLSSVKKILDGFAVVGSKEEIKNKNLSMDKFVDEINDLSKKYDELDKKILTQNNNTDDEVAVEVNTEIIEKKNGLFDLYELIKEGINLSSCSQEKIYNMLTFINDNRHDINYKFCEMSKRAEEYYIFNKERDNVGALLHRSTDEDKIVNYELVFTENNNEGQKEFKRLINVKANVKFENSKKIIFKKVDRKYIIERLIDSIIHEYEYTIRINELNNEYLKENSIGKLNRNLFVLNTIAPIVGGVGIIPIIQQVYNSYGKYGLIAILIGGVLLIGIIIILYRRTFVGTKNK